MKNINRNRLERFRELLSKQNLDAFIVLIGENRRYLSGFTGEDTQFDESAGALFITADAAILTTDSRYHLQALAEAEGWEVRLYREGLSQILPEMIGAFGSRKIGFESVRLSCHQYRQIREKLEESQLNVEWFPFDFCVEKLRIQKEPMEVAMIRKALILAEEAFRKVVINLSPGISEKEIAWQMEKAMREHGADSLSFPTIVASGPNSALPHAIPGDRKVQKGEPVLFDWGVRLNGYCSDISRTLVIGEPDERFRNVFRTVREAQQKAIALIRHGSSGQEVDRAAREHIEQAGYKGLFGHSLGHGVGLAIHESPRLSPVKNDRLQEGMVVTVEPGIYIPEWGGVRLENLVVVRKDGAEELNTLPIDVGFSVT